MYCKIFAWIFLLLLGLLFWDINLIIIWNIHVFHTFISQNSTHKTTLLSMFTVHNYKNCYFHFFQSFHNLAHLIGLIFCILRVYGIYYFRFSFSRVKYPTATLLVVYNVLLMFRPTLSSKILSHVNYMFDCFLKYKQISLCTLFAA